MTESISIDGRRSSLNHTEMWGYSDSWNCVYIRFRSGKVELRFSNQWTESAEFISEDDAEITVTKTISGTNYSELKRLFDDWNGVLKDTGYSIDQPDFSGL